MTGSASPDVDFRNLYRHGFARIAACTLPVTMADPHANAAAILDRARHVGEQGAAVALFPELGLTGYAIDDLLLQDVLLREVEAALVELARGTADLLPLVVVGAPLRHRNRLYNCAVLIHRGEVIGIAPKSYLPNYREFYEKRHFASGEVMADELITIAGVPGPTGEPGEEIPFGPDLIFRASDLPDLSFHVEVCEDMWVPVPPSALAALGGAHVLVNLSGSPITVAKSEDRHLLTRSASARCTAAYVFAAAGEGEIDLAAEWRRVSRTLFAADVDGASG